MSDFLSGEQVIPVPPLSIKVLERVGEALLSVLCPTALNVPTRLNILRWVEHELPDRGIHVSPATQAELGDAEAVTIPDGDEGDPIEILMQDDFYDRLQFDGPRAYRARATVAHELSHAILHVPVIRRRQKSAFGNLHLQRVSRQRLRPFEDPEWQAWALAGCILMPRRTLRMLKDTELWRVSDTYGVSEQMARAHLGRLKM